MLCFPYAHTAQESHIYRSGGFFLRLGAISLSCALAGYICLPGLKLVFIYCWRAAVGDYGGLNCKYSAALSLIKAGTARCDRLQPPPSPSRPRRLPVSANARCKRVCVSFFTDTQLHSCTREYSTRVGNHSPPLTTI